ncbi:MAG: PAS domain S-box protein [Desulfobulbaceae bacterium]|nr:MAG: PAS domain S-box protein [Desulfobulbaceae bacterium]
MNISAPPPDEFIRRIADLEQQVKTLQEQEKRYLPIIENSPDILYRTDLEGKITFISPSVYKLSGYGVEEAIGMNMAQEVYLNPDERQDFIKMLQEHGKVKNFTAQLKKKDGTIWWASTNAHFYYTASGEIEGVEGITRDITEIMKSAKALAQSERSVRSIIDSSPMGVHLYALEGNNSLIFTGYNSAADKILGLSHRQFVGRSIEEVFPELGETEIPDIYRNICVNGKSWQTEQILYQDTNLSGAFEVYAFQTAPDHMAVFFLDITQRKKDQQERELLRKQLLQAQKMEAIGTLAGGIAHDFNNLLMGIQGRVSLALADNQAGSTTYDHLINIESYIRSASELTKQLLGFARGGKYEVKTLDVNHLITESADLFGRTNKEINIHYQLTDDLHSVEADRQQLHQVLLNLYVNSWQAMPDGGKLSIRTTNTSLDPQFASAHGAQSGPFIRIEITDTGIGMEQDVLEKIFEPFFTTKEKSRGTGLGLASVYGIIQNHHGIITAKSSPGVGSTFDIYLPASPNQPPIDSQEKKQTTLAEGTESILLVDDEESVLSVCAEMLTMLGYRVASVQSGIGAVDYYKAHADEIDLVILDMIMPDLDGFETFLHMKKIKPSLTVLLSSGYSLDGKAAQLLAHGSHGFIQKPFRLEELSDKVRHCLDNQSALS